MGVTGCQERCDKTWDPAPPSAPPPAPPTFHSTSNRKSGADIGAQVGGGAQEIVQWAGPQDDVTLTGGPSRSAGGGRGR